MMSSRTIAILAIAFACAMHAAPAQAQVSRTFVSATGSDSNNCANVSSPCRHFAAAFAVTATNGEIYVLDPANYGSLTINHAVSIQGHGWGSIAPVSGGNGITINAQSTDAINLDGLTIDGTALTTTNGIVFNSGQSLTIENCVVRNVTNDGLQFWSMGTTKQTLTVSNSYFTDNGKRGLIIQPISSGAVTAAIDRTVFAGSVYGLVVFGDFGTGVLSVGVTDSVAANNSGDGFAAAGAAAHSVSGLSLTHSLAVGNGIGVEALGTNATIWLAQSTITGNASAFSASMGGVINSYGDNYIGAANGAPTGSFANVVKQ
jgi:hypothetical protein